MVTTADKGGGVVIMDNTEYLAKMESMLGDRDTYEKQEAGRTVSESKRFNDTVRKILRKSEKGRKLVHLLEESPSSPTMRGLPKTHKPEVPLRPITSGIGSAPHRLARTLAGPLGSLLGKVSSAHLKNSGDFLDRVKDVDMRGKKLVSFDVVAFHKRSSRGSPNSGKISH